METWFWERGSAVTTICPVCGRWVEEDWLAPVIPMAALGYKPYACVTCIARAFGGEKRSATGSIERADQQPLFGDRKTTGGGEK
jgi:hypothetical protein